MNDLLIIGGAGCFIIGCYLLTPAAGIIAVGLLLMAVGLARIRGQHGPG